MSAAHVNANHRQLPTIPSLLTTKITIVEMAEEHTDGCAHVL